LSELEFDASVLAEPGWGSVVRPAEEEAAGFVVDEGVGDGLDNARAVKGAKSANRKLDKGSCIMFMELYAMQELKCCNIEASRACKRRNSQRTIREFGRRLRRLDWTSAWLYESQEWRPRY